MRSRQISKQLQRFVVLKRNFPSFGRNCYWMLCLKDEYVFQTFDAYLVGKEDAPGIVVIQEWWGVDFEIKNNAVKIAKLGYKALIPNLYRGKVGLDAAEAQHLMSGLDWQGAVKDIEASVNWLKANVSQKVGVTGYCMGGALTIASAVLVPGIEADVAFYGVPPPVLADPANTKVPIQAHFGEVDDVVGFSDIKVPWAATKII